MFGVVDNTPTTKFTSRACAVHCNSPVVVDKAVVVVLKFPNVCRRRTCNLEKTSLINCTGHPIMHITPTQIRGCVLVPRTQLYVPRPVGMGVRWVRSQPPSHKHQRSTVLLINDIKQSEVGVLFYSIPFVVRSQA